MYIQPDSDVIILKDVPLDNTYDHTIYFSNATQQHDYFYAKKKYEINKHTYARLNRGYIKVQRKADDLYDCNYIMYRNTAYGAKWFYAFIKTIEYINDNVSQIEFEIDVMQTWHFDYTLGQSFVEREHSATDVIGENILPEDVPLGDYNRASESDVVYKSSNVLPSQIGADTWAIVVVSNWDEVGVRHNGGVATYQFSGLYYSVFTNDANHTAVEKLQYYINMMNQNGRLDLIFNIFYAFGEFVCDTNWTTYPTFNQPLQTPNVIEKLVPKYGLTFKNDYAKSDAVDEPYTPHNNKLYTFPYNYLKLTDYKGNEVDYKYEFFSRTYSDVTVQDGYKFYLTGDLSPAPSVIATPSEYLCSEQFNNTRKNYDYSFVLDGFPQCTWSGDAFTAWFAQTQYKTSGAMLATVLGQTLRGVANGVTSYISGESVPSESGAPFIGNQINGLMARLGAQAGEAVRRGNNVYGTQSGSLSMALDKFGIFACNMKIRKDYAMIIDSYFDRFGYKTMKTKIPNTYVRQNWTYTKTVGCVLAVSNLPADDARKVCSIYDKGVTFWDKDAIVGDYTQPNNVLI